MNILSLAPDDKGVRVTEHGLQINRQLSLDDWRDLLAQARRIKTAYLSVLSDITSYGRARFGDNLVNDALEQLEFEMSDATKAETIALIPLDRRVHFNLSSEHAYVLGSMLSEDSERDRWAAICQENSLTAFELKKSIEKGEILYAADITERSGHGEGMASIQAVQFSYQKWLRQFPEPAAILKLPPPERRKILDSLIPMVELASQLETSLTPPKKSR